MTRSAWVTRPTACLILSSSSTRMISSRSKSCPLLSNHPNGILLQDNLNIGIPKKILVLAFLRARELFFSDIKAAGPSSPLAFEATRVILLFDTEFITVANFRKRRLLQLRGLASVTTISASHHSRISISQ